MFVWHEQENATTAAQALADAVATALQTALNEKGHAVLAVSGGRSPIAFFEALSQKDLNWQTSALLWWTSVLFRPRMPNSNTGLVREYLLKNNAAVATWIPVVEDGKSETELQPEVVVAYALKHSSNLDVLVLGMGSDGHTASLFPQAPQLQAAINEADDPTLIHTTPVTAPHERVSMTFGCNCQNAECVFGHSRRREKKQYLIKLPQGPIPNIRPA